MSEKSCSVSIMRDPCKTEMDRLGAQSNNANCSEMNTGQ